MITHDGSKVVSVETGSFIKIDNILYIDGGCILEGLNRVRPLKIYFKQEKEPLNIQYNSAVRSEIYEALELFHLTYHQQYPFVVYRSGYVINMFSISRMTQRGLPGRIKYKILFDTGLEIDVPVELYTSLFDIIKEAVGLDNNKYVKKTILGFMQKKR